MRSLNFDPVTVPAAAPAGLPGTVIFDNATFDNIPGSEWVTINPSVAIVIVGAQDANVPNSKDGTVANSPDVIPAGVPTVVYHRSGPMYALSTGADSTVKVSIKAVP